MLELPLPLHLSVHLVGLAVSTGLLVDAWGRRRAGGTTWLSLLAAGALLATSHLLIGGLVVTDGLLPLLLRAGAYASVAVAAVGTSAVAVVLVAPVGARILTAVVGLLAAAAARGGTLGRGRHVLPLTIGVVGWAVGDLVAGRVPVVGAVVSLVGSVAVGAWLLERADRSLATRFTASAVGVVLLVVLLLASGAGFAFDRDLENDRLTRLDTAAMSQVARLATDPSAELAAAVDLLDDTSQLSARLVQGSADDAFAAGVQSLARTPDLVLLLDADGRVLGSHDRRSDGPMGTAETTLAGTSVAAAALAQRQPVADLVRLELEESATDAPELLAVAADVVFADPGRRDVVAGALVLARRLTTTEVVARVAQDTGSAAAIVVGGRLASASEDPGTLASGELADAAARSGTRLVDIAGQDRFVAVADLRDASGDALGALVLYEDGTVVAGLQRLVVRTLFLAAALGGLVAAGLVNLVTRRTTTPLRRLTTAAEQVADGDLAVEVVTTGRDEVGRLGTAFAEMTDALQVREGDLRTAAAVQRELRERLEGVTGAMGEALLAVDLDGRVTMANRAASDLLARPIEDLLDAVAADVVDGSDDLGLPLLDVLGHPDATARSSARGEVRRDGRSAVAVAATAAPLLDDDGSPLGRVLVLRDVDNEAQVERMKTEFLSNISHELRTPLTPIRAYAQLLAARPDLPDEKVEEFAGSITSAATRLERIIGMLVDFAALEAGRVEVELEPLDVGEAVDGARERWGKRHPDRVLRRRVARRLPPVLADAGLLDRVLDELLDNALKFSDDVVTVVASRADDGRIEIGVKDHGPGLDPEAMASLSEGFHQGDGSATRAHGGLGLGLSIVGRVVGELDGTLEASSEPGRLTHVRVRLPAAPSRSR